MQDYGSSIADFVQTAQARGDSGLTYVTDASQMVVDAVGSGACTPNGSYTQKFYMYKVPGETTQTDRLWGKAYANIFEKNDKVYFVLGIQDASHFVDGLIPDRSDRIYMLLDYIDLDGEHLYKLIGFYNYESLSINLKQGTCLTYAALTELPKIADGSEVLVKYIFTNNHTIDTRYIAPGAYYPITDEGQQLCYGQCNTVETGSIAGVVVDATNNQPIINAHICTNDGADCDDSNEFGAYRIDGLSIGYHQVKVTASGYSEPSSQTTAVVSGQVSMVNFAMSPILTCSEVRIVLTWGENPSDLDAHLWLPPDNPSHIFYNNKGDCTTFPYACLDVDDTSAYGPETITIKQPFAGRYLFAVHHFRGSGALTTSNAKVDVYTKDGLVESLMVPISGSGNWWNVFDIDGVTGDIDVWDYITSTPPDPY